MSGLALGSFLGGRKVDKIDNALHFYAKLELAIGAFCFLIPFLIEAIQPVLKWIYLTYQGDYLKASFTRFLLCSLILIIPTTCMGATLPVLGKFISCNSRLVGRDVGTLYATNTFGAVLGALSGVFLFMPWLGLRGTLWLAALINVAIGLVIIAFLNKEIDPQVAEDNIPPGKGDAVKGCLRWTTLIIFGVSGTCALIYQVAWNRIFSLLLGSSVYAFSLIVATFVLGLAFGAAAFARWCDKFSDRVCVFGVLQVGIGISVLMLLPFYGKIPLWNRWGYETLGAAFGKAQWTNFGIIFLFLLVPTFLMGGQFPVVVRLIAGNFYRMGRHIGNAYAFNTVGAIIGSFIGGFILIPFIGLQKTIIVAVFLNVTLGLCLLAFASKVSFNFKMYVIPSIVFCFLVSAKSIPPWDRAIMSSGSYMPYRIKDLDEAINRTNKILFYQEGLHTTVTTELAASGNIFLRVNGKTDASLALDMRTQLLSGYLPMLLHENPRSALVIGHGSGITLGAVERFPIESIDLVEISKGVIDGSRYFYPFNHDALSDKRVRVLLEDGRNHVALTDKKYDIIISEPSNPWISGVGTLFTEEFFQLLKSKLNPGGIACIWVHTNLSPESFKSIIKTYRRSFPNVVMWESIVGDDYLLIGSKEPYHLRYEKTQEHLLEPEIKKDMKKIGVKKVEDLMSLVLMSGEGLDRFSEKAPVHTDDNLLLEFSTPAYIYKDDRVSLVRQLTPYFNIDVNLVSFDKDLGERERNRIRKGIASLKRSQSQIEEIKRKARIQGLLESAEEDFNAGRIVQAERKYAEILMIEPEHIMAYLNLGKVYQVQEKPKRAEWAYRKTLDINPFYIFGSLALAKFQIAFGKAEDAVNTLQKLNAWHSGDAEAWVYLGLAYSFLKRNGKAGTAFEKALRLDPGLPEAYYYAGIFYASGNVFRAKRNLKTFLELASGETSPKLVERARKLLSEL